MFVFLPTQNWRFSYCYIVFAKILRLNELHAYFFSFVCTVELIPACFQNVIHITTRAGICSVVEQSLKVIKL
jgi:hypothetical protein